MSGIFNYYVPGVSSQQKKELETRSTSKDVVKSFKDAMPKGDSGINASPLLKALYSLLAQLISQLDQEGARPSPDTATTLALGEEEGGIKPPEDVTTQAFPEEGIGIKPPNPPELTTQAIGEEEGGIKMPMDAVTLAYSEESSGLESDINTLKGLEEIFDRSMEEKG